MESHKPNGIPTSTAGMRVVIATPCYGGMLSSNYVHSLAHTIPALIQLGIDFEMMSIPNESIVSKARNTLVAAFLSIPDATHLLFIDADMGWNPSKIIRMVSSGKDVIGAAGPRKQLPLSFATLLENPITVDPVTGFLKAVSVGTGFLLIARRAIEHMIDNDPENYYKDYATGEKIPNIFEFQIHNNNFWSEDYTFCNKWRALGGEIWVDPHFELEHVGSQVFKGALQEVLQPIGNYFLKDGDQSTGGLTKCVP